MSGIRADAEAKMKKSVASLREEYLALRSDRATPALFNKISVDCYGAKTPLSQVATISIPEARLVVIQPWDTSLINDIEKSILSSGLSLVPNNDGKVIRLIIPPLNEQRRKELIKQAKSMAEIHRVSIRNLRRDTNDLLKKNLKEGIITEDEEKKALDEVQKATDLHIKEIDKIVAEKEKEILGV